MTGNRTRYIAALFGFDAIVRRVPAGDWDQPAPCEGWSARDVLDHNLFVMGMVQGLAEGRDAGVAPSEDNPLPTLVEGVQLATWLPFTTLQPGDDPVEVWSEHVHSALDALESVDPLTLRVRSIWNHETLDGFLEWVFYDPIVHTWDLAVAVGLEPVVDTRLAAEAVDYITQHEELLRQAFVLGDPVAPRSDDPLDRLLAFCGREQTPS